MKWTVIFVSRMQTARKVKCAIKREATALLRGRTQICRVGRTYFVYG